MPNSRNSVTMSGTRLLRRSGTFSLKVMPRTPTRALDRALRGDQQLDELCATKPPMPSLIRRPARMTSG